MWFTASVRLLKKRSGSVRLFFSPWPVFSPMVRTPAAFPAKMSFRITDHPALFQIDVKSLCRLHDHTRTGLSAAAFFLEGGIFSGESTIRVMRAVVDGIDKGTLMSEFGFHLVVDLPQTLYICQVPGDHALVGGDHTQVVRRIDALQGIGGVWIQFEVFGSVDEVGIVVQYAVAVQEDGLLPAPQISSLHFAAEHGLFYSVSAVRSAHILQELRSGIAVDLSFLDGFWEDVLSKIRSFAFWNVFDDRLAEKVECRVHQIAVPQPFGVGLGEKCADPLVFVGDHQVGIVGMVIGV